MPAFGSGYIDWKVYYRLPDRHVITTAFMLLLSAVRRPSHASSTFTLGLSVNDPEPPGNVPVGSILPIESVFEPLAMRCNTTAVVSEDCFYAFLTAYYLLRSRQSSLHALLGMKDRPLLDLDDPNLSILGNMGLRTGAITGGSGRNVDRYVYLFM